MNRREDARSGRQLNDILPSRFLTSGGVGKSIKRLGCLTIMVALLVVAHSDSSGTGPLGRPALLHERLGLHAGEDFLLTTGDCDACGISPAARWYFRTKLIAVPEQAGLFSPFVWIGSPEILTHARLLHASDGATELALQTDTQTVPFALAPKLSTNRSYYDDSTSAFFSGRPLRIRGRTEMQDGIARYVGRTIWPLDFNLTPDFLPSEPLEEDRTLERLIIGQMDALSTPLYQRLLWARDPERRSASGGSPVLAFVLNGAQGDDDDAHWGHMAVATGYLGNNGEWGDWLVYNFYPLDKLSEKGIVTAMVPMDNYLADLNQGQNFYRPSYLTIAILRDDRIARIVEAPIRQVMHHTYCHLVEYDQATMNSTSKSIDTLRSIGWHIPDRGPAGMLKAVAAFMFVATTQWNLEQARSLFNALTAETSRILPRVAYEAVTLDLLHLLTGQVSPDRTLSQLEQMLIEDVEAVLFVRVPQFPSSRAFGTYPVSSFESYLYRVPKDPKQWERVDAPSVDFPEQLRESCARGSNER